MKAKPRTWNVWWTTPSGDHKGKVLGMFPYTGRYKEFFTHVLRIESCTRRGWNEIAVKL